MERALGLAREVRGHVWPNPPVGCVIVKDGNVVGEAATDPGGRPHAERKAIEQAGQVADGATLFVTLEPCCHWGKTPPCTDAIIDAGISRVVCAVQDPDPRVNGGGFAMLREAGIGLVVGVCSAHAEAMMSGFFHRVHYGVPELVVSLESGEAIPDGTDGVLVSRETEVVITTRSGIIESVLQNPHHLLRWLGSLGLTTVAIPKQDSFWRNFQSHAEVAEHNDRSQMAILLREVGW
ncbi:MAG: bifunctional diaminohydroxyphosphoribosylaminopyrimidine deaminase/5-amino-6-(5-phosphoribosylamino)uracil reductase RibD [Rhodobacteraceae bacterium]|nr:bifunctional diaminohydroxyphosphoribosylaminopyrimidine deaminase/5-amino-6-(5-phosphoribosylamino)uracil reductase RibD [Paracoccaceae bacterium]